MPRVKQRVKVATGEVVELREELGGELLGSRTARAGGRSRSVPGASYQGETAGFARLGHSVSSPSALGERDLGENRLTFGHRHPGRAQRRGEALSGVSKLIV